MLYDDTARRFNFIVGLGIGAILGTGVALLLAPQDRVRFRKRPVLPAIAAESARALRRVRRR